MLNMQCNISITNVTNILEWSNGHQVLSGLNSTNVIFLLFRDLGNLGGKLFMNTDINYDYFMTTGERKGQQE